MALRIYIVPMVTELVGTKFDIHPQYIYGLPYIWAAIPYGSDDVCICGVHDISRLLLVYFNSILGGQA